MEKRKNLFYTICAVLLSSLASLWVIVDRWLGPLPGNRLIRKIFIDCPWRLFCQSTLPPFVIVSFLFWTLSLAAVLFLGRKHQISPSVFRTPEISDTQVMDQSDRRFVLISRILLWTSAAGFLLVIADSFINERIPGWNLIVVFLCFLAGFLFGERVPFADWIRKHGGLAAALILHHVSFIALLYVWTGPRQWTVAAAAAVLISSGVLWRYRDRLSPVYFIFLLALVMFSLGNNTWWSAYVGDEYAQFRLDLMLIRDRDWLWIGENLFNAKGNFGTTPMLASYIQAFFMKILGVNGFGWRFSNAYLCAAGIVLLYFFLRKFVVDRVALAAAVLLAVSEYLIDFGKIGYTNLQAFFAAALELALVGWASQSKSKIIFCLMGFSLAFCCYSFPAALYALPLPFLYLCFYYPPNNRDAIRNWGIMLAALSMLSFPLFMQPEYWQTKIPGTILANPQAVDSAGGIVYHVLSNLFYAFYSFLYVQQETHFVAASYADPLTGIFILVGFCVILMHIRKARFPTFWMASFLMMLLAAGVSHGYSLPPTTRMFLLLPWWMVFAATGLEYLLVQFSDSLPLSEKGLLVLRAVVLLLVLGLNLYQANVLAARLYGSRPALESILLYQSEEADRIHSGSQLNFIILTDTSWTTEEIADFLLAYPEFFGNIGITSTQVVDGVIPQSVSKVIADPDTMVVLIPFNHIGWQAAVEKALSAGGRIPCRIRTSDDEEIIIFSSQKISSLCGK